MAKLVHFELTSPDAARTADFYAAILGWSVAPSPFVPDYHVLTGPSRATGAVMADRYHAQPAILWFEVDDLEQSIDAIESAGGKRAGEINAIPGEGRVVYASDPNGTVFGLKQP